MLLINGRSCVNLLLASRLHQANLSYKIIATKNCSPPPPLFVALNHASLALLPEEITGSTFNSMWVWCHQQPNAEFILRSYELGLKNLGQVISLQKIYQHLEHNVPQDHVGKKTSEINMFTTQHANPSRTIARSVGIAKQLLIKLDGFDGAFQIFAWPHILGFLPIDGHGNYACIFASQNSESIPWDSPEEILATLNNFTKTKGIIVRDCH